MGVKVRTLPMDETDTFFELFQMAEENMVSNLETNHTFMKCKTYKDHAMLKFAYIDLKDYLSTLNKTRFINSTIIRSRCCIRGKP